MSRSIVGVDEMEQSNRGSFMRYVVVLDGEADHGRGKDGVKESVEQTRGSVVKVEKWVM